MSLAAAPSPPRPVSPDRSTLPPRQGSPLNPLSRPPKTTRITASAAATTSTRTHLANLDRLLLKQVPTSQPNPTHQPSSSHDSDSTSPRGGRAGSGLFNALNLPSLFPHPTEQMSPRSLAHLHRLLSDSPRVSPKNSIGSRWRLYHGAADWAGLLDPLDENLRRELVRYGDLIGAAYHAFHSRPSARPDRPRHVVLPDRSYHVTASLYASSSLDLPRWVASAVPPWMTQPSSWMGYVAVCDSEREIQRMGRRDIVIALRGTATCLEWAENFRAGLVPIEDKEEGTESVAKVACGFWSLFKTPGKRVPSLAESVVAEVRRLMDKYKGEELSISITGHSLGAALGLLVADELAGALGPSAPPVAVFSFGGPKVGNQAFVDRVEARGVKALRVVEAHDVVTKVPGMLPASEAYAHVGRELRVDSRASPYLRPNAGPGCCHDLEAYLHLVDGFMGTGCPFRSNAKRSIARLFDQQRASVKSLYVNKARELGVGPLDPAAAAVLRSGATGCLPSPSA